MKRPARATFLWLFVAPAVLSWSTGCQPVVSSGVPAEVVLVRHAEKVDDSRDPDLSTAGLARSTQLASMLRDLDFDHVWSTDFKRTRDTAAPSAQAATLAVELYDPSDLPAFAAQLTGMGGRHLVVGHSNTTPELVAALGGDPGTPIDDAEYDRLYVIHVSSDGTAATTLLRFGDPFGS